MQRNLSLDEAFFFPTIYLEGFCSIRNKTTPSFLCVTGRMVPRLLSPKSQSEVLIEVPHNRLYLGLPFHLPRPPSSPPLPFILCFIVRGWLGRLCTCIAYVWRSEPFVGIFSLLPPSGCLGSNSGHQSWVAGPSPAEHRLFILYVGFCCTA